MSRQLVIVLSGRKQSGKSSSCNYILARMLNKVWGTTSFTISDEGLLLQDGKLHVLQDQHSKVYSFADPLKRFCIDVLGVPESACYGNDEEKNAPTHLQWETVSYYLRWYNGGRWVNGYHGAEQLPTFIGEEDFYLARHAQQLQPFNLKSGPMSGRDIMQVMGTDICRRLYGDCWARGTFNTIKNEGRSLSLVCDGRFPNEIDIGSEVNAITIRLLRNPFPNDTHKSETALDNYPLEKYSHVIDNREASLEEQCRMLDPLIDGWFASAGL
jgi:hypothetical protein